MLLPSPTLSHPGSFLAALLTSPGDLSLINNSQQRSEIRGELRKEGRKDPGQVAGAASQPSSGPVMFHVL